MEYDSKLKGFSEVVLREASEEKQRLLTTVKERIGEATKKTKDEIIKKAEQELRLETEKTARQKNENLSKSAMDMRKVIIEKREDFIEQMHNSVVGRLLGFVKSSEYVSWMVEQIKDGQKQLKDKNVIVYIGESDKTFSESIITKANVKVVIDKEITIGGCKIISEVKKMLVDNTLQKRLDEAFSDFHMLAIKNQ